MKKMKTASFFLFVIFLVALDNPVSAALPSNELWREDLTNNVIGFGKNTTGGKGGTLCQVTNLNNSGAGSLRACAEAVGALWITFTVSGTITLSSEIYIKSNKTIDGRGRNIVIANRGFILGRWHAVGNTTDNVIIENISIKNITGNAGTLIAEDASNIWIDHVTFDNPADENLYVGSDGSDSYSGAAPYGITVSWSHFLSPTKGSVLVSDPSLPEDVGTTLTLHHNYYQTHSRTPLARYAKIHAFNNYHDQGETSVDALTNVQYYSENEIFQHSASGSIAMVKVWVGGTLGSGGDDPRGALNTKVLNPMLINGATVQQVNASSIFDPSSYYAYTADTANASLETALVANAGWRNVTTPILPQSPTNLAVK